MTQRRAFRFRRPARDAGMTLPELLVSVAITGTLVTAMAMAATLIVRQVDNNSGRLNNSRSEQAVGIWLPSDLASAELVYTEANKTPCGSACTPELLGEGSNALQLSWTGSVPGVTESIPTTTTVSYRYVKVGAEYEIRRISCLVVGTGAPSCEMVTVLHDLQGPPVSEPWIPGTTEPSWVMLVRLALDPADITNGAGGVLADPTYHTKNGRRVTVTINGGGDVAGAGGGQDVITLSAGGTDRQPNLATNNLSDAATFGTTRSRCGGNFGMLVDTSTSIGSTNMSSVRGGLTAFVNEFAGTPIRLQVVRFSNTATTLGAGSNWSRYYDMLVESDVADLKTQITTLNSSGSTNWEDGLFRMFQNSNGTVQSTLPDTLIFFTDGMPTYNRLNGTSASAAAVADPDDAGLPVAGGTTFNQLSWNRANRIARQYDADVQRFIGVFVGADTSATSTWTIQGAGYHLTNFLRGYHALYEQGYHLVNPVRGYHIDYQFATTGINYQYNSANAYQYNQTGFMPQQKGGSWANTTWASYLNGITGSNPSKFQVVANAAATGGWATMTKAQFDARSLGAAAPAAAFRVVGSTAGTWTNINTGSSASAIATARTYYQQYNTTSANTDGFRISNNGTPGGWTTTSAADYNLHNITANDGTASDVNDGYQRVKLYSTPYSLWDPTTDALYLAGNTSAGTTDGWDATTAYSLPFTYWATSTAAAYAAGSPTNPAGWRLTKLYSSPYSSWDSATEAEYNTGNQSWGTTDGWDATKTFTPPYTLNEPNTTTSVANTEILSRLITVGTPVPAVPTGGPYTNAAVADLYVLPNWNQFADAIDSVALAECGGTVTLQTRVGTAAAADPFTYQNSVDKKIATTSSLYRSGTFDYDLSGGISTNASITPLNLDTLQKYAPVSWTCKASGVDYPFTTTLVDGVWSKINLTVSPNKAISCIQTVTLK